MESRVSCWYFPWANHSWKPGWYSPQTVSLRAQSRMVKGGGWICIGKQDFYPSVECSYCSNHSPSFAAPGWFSQPLALWNYQVCVCCHLLCIQETHITLSNSVEPLHPRPEVRGESFWAPLSCEEDEGRSTPIAFSTYFPLHSNYLPFNVFRMGEERGKSHDTAGLAQLSHTSFLNISAIVWRLQQKLGWN